MEIKLSANELTAIANRYIKQRYGMTVRETTFRSITKTADPAEFKEKWIGEFNFTCELITSDPLSGQVAKDIGDADRNIDLKL
jgi:hypothetical protein